MQMQHYRGRQGENSETRKERVRLEAVQKPSSWTKLHCVCGITKATEEEVHIKTKKSTLKQIVGFVATKIVKLNVPLPGL